MQFPAALIEINVQFDEIDSFRIAHHSRLVVYLERARIQLLSAMGFTISNPLFAVAIYSMKLDFKKPARILERLQVSSEIEQVDGFKLILSERIRRADSLIMKARTEIAFLELETFQPVPVESVFPGLQEAICH